MNGKRGFTVVELLVAMLISSMLISATVSTYSLFRKSLLLDMSRADLAQNARVVLDRLSRELRQTQDVLTPFPVSPSDTSIPQPGEIVFQDGHNNDLTYRHYYVNNGVLKLDIKEYYFDYDSGNRVNWNAIGTSGQRPEERVISSQDIAERITSIAFYGKDRLTIELVTADTLNQTYSLKTTVLGRNTTLGRNP